MDLVYILYLVIQHQEGQFRSVKDGFRGNKTSFKVIDIYFYMVDRRLSDLRGSSEARCLRMTTAEAMAMLTAIRMGTKTRRRVLGCASLHAPPPLSLWLTDLLLCLCCRPLRRRWRISSGSRGVCLCSYGRCSSLAVATMDLTLPLSLL